MSEKNKAILEKGNAAIAEGDFLTALGDIILKDEDGTATHYSYCDIWRFRGDKIVELRAFVIKI